MPTRPGTATHARSRRRAAALTKPPIPKVPEDVLPTITAPAALQVSRPDQSLPSISPQTRTPRMADGSTRPLLVALTEGRGAASTKAVTTASTPGLPLQALSGSDDGGADTPGIVSGGVTQSVRYRQ